MRYEAIAEQEVTANWVKDIQEFKFTLQAIAVSEGGDGHYVTLIESL